MICEYCDCDECFEDCECDRCNDRRIDFAESLRDSYD